jgi:Zn finger protein HypA/HybF involved in hydrogenase expression
MLNELEQKILDAYQDGSDVGYIIECLNTTHSKVKEVLLAYKDANRYKRTFTDEFKRMIAERDINGVARRQIALELEINVNTVKKACEQFGQAFKEKATSENEYTRIDGEFGLDTCPSCGSNSVNIVEDNTTYCKKCGNEHIIKEDHALKINWEYLDE